MRELRLTLTVTVPDDTDEGDVLDALRVTLDEAPGMAGRMIWANGTPYWGAWQVGAIMVEKTHAECPCCINNECECGGEVVKPDDRST